MGNMVEMRRNYMIKFSKKDMSKSGGAFVISKDSMGMVSKSLGRSSGGLSKTDGMEEGLFVD